jgi:type VI protein secretion system component Hcp
MATDVYIKFGTTKEKIGPLNTPRPLIEGDSTDELHYWWCELRNCGFDLEAKDPEPKPAADGTTPEADKEKSKAKFPKVTLKKRLDWASTQLFIRCCEQAMALSKSREEQEKGWIDIVSVEVCRPAGGEKIPFVIVEYHGVRLVRYAIEMSGPEPSESITFEFQKLAFQHTRTDPFTGKVAARDPVSKTGELANSGTGQGGTAQGGGGAPADASPGSGAPASSGVVVASGGGGTSSSGASATPAGPSSAVDVAVNTNFPGLWQGTGFGVLPD